MDKDMFARQVTDLQGSLYRIAASYLRCEGDRLDTVAEAIAREHHGALRAESDAVTTRFTFTMPLKK